jgi:hypothetical protein
MFVFPELVIAIICGRRRNFVYESGDDDDGVYQLLRRSSGKNKEEDDGRDGTGDDCEQAVKVEVLACVLCVCVCLRV